MKSNEYTRIENPVNEVKAIYIDRLRSFLGLPHTINENIGIYSPTIKEIGEIGFIEYNVKLNLCLFDKEKILLQLFNLDEALFLTIKDAPDYSVLTDHPVIRNHIADALSFFFKEKVSFSEKTLTFNVDNCEVVSNDNYLEIARIIKELNGISTNETELKPTSNKANQLLQKMLVYSNTQDQKNNYLELKDILSILCSARGNGINIFNVADLTVYQVYEQFERVNVKESFDRMLPIWANGHLSKDSKMPEWITKTKL